MVEAGLDSVGYLLDMVGLEQRVEHKQVVVLLPLEPAKLLELQSKVEDPAPLIYLSELSAFHFNFDWPCREIFKIFQLLLCRFQPIEDAVDDGSELLL